MQVSAKYTLSYLSRKLWSENLLDNVVYDGFNIFFNSTSNKTAFISLGVNSQLSVNYYVCQERDKRETDTHTEWENGGGWLGEATGEKLYLLHKLYRTEVLKTRLIFAVHSFKKV